MNGQKQPKADHRYHTHVGTVLDLSRRMGEIFESSEPGEKRVISRFLLQNPVVGEKTLGFDLRSSFNFVHELTSIGAKQKTAETVVSSGSLLVASSDHALELSESRKQIQGSKKFSVKVRPERNSLTSDPLLPN